MLLFVVVELVKCVCQICGHIAKIYPLNVLVLLFLKYKINLLISEYLQC